MMRVGKFVNRYWFAMCTALYASLVSGSVMAQNATTDELVGGLASEMDNVRLSAGWGVLAGVLCCVFAGAGIALKEKKWLWGSAVCVVGAIVWYGGGTMFMRIIPRAGQRIAQ